MLNSGIRFFTLLIFIVLLLSAPVAASRFSLETDHFLIHFDAGMEEVAQEAAIIAEEVHNVLAPRVGHVPAVKTHIIILDETDLANGYADPILYPKITIFPVSPVFFNTYSSGFSPRITEWLRLLILHEYAHVLHLDMKSEAGLLIELLFGRVPLVTNPILMQSYAFIEGFATYQESNVDLGGRGQDPFYRMFLRTMVLENDFLHFDQILGHYPLDRWKPGAAVYLYGYALWQFMADHYGEDAHFKFNQVFARQLNLETTFRTALGTTSAAFYDAWHQHLRRQYIPEINSLRKQGVTPTEILGGYGYVPQTPTASPDGTKLAYATVNGPVASALRLIDMEGDNIRDRQLVSGVIMGPISWSPDGRYIYYAKVTAEKGNSFSDIYRYSMVSGRETRITRGLRAVGPAVSPDGKRLVFTSRSGLANRLVQLDLSTSLPVRPGNSALVEILPEVRNAQRLAAGWFADGRSLLVYSYETGGGMDLLRLDPDTTDVEELIIGSRARGGHGFVNQNAQFTPDGRFILFDSDRTGVYNLYAYDLNSGKTLTVARTLTGLFNPTVIQTQSGPKIVAMEYTAQGYRLIMVPYQPDEWQVSEPWEENSEPEAVSSPHVAATETQHEFSVRPYSPRNSLWPQFIVPFWVEDEAGSLLGATTFGYDAYQEHAYAAELGWGIHSGRPHVYLDYSGTLSRRHRAIWGAQLIHDTLVDSDETKGTVRRGLGVATTYDWPILLKNTRGWAQVQLLQRRSVVSGVPQSSWYPAQVAAMGLAHSKSWPIDDRNVRLQTNLTLSTLREGIGWTRQGNIVTWQQAAGISWDAGRKSLDGQIMMGTSTLEDGFTLGPTHGRFGSWGDWSLRADGPELSGRYAARFVVGLNRQVARIGRGLGTTPLFFDDVRFRLFTEGGGVWTDLNDVPNTRWSVGASARLTAYTAYSAPVTFELGAAMAMEQENKPITIYFSIGLDDILGLSGRNLVETMTDTEMLR